MMQKFFLLLAPLMLIACGKAKPDSAQTEQSPEPATEQTAPQVQQPAYLSSDLQFFDLYGPVETVTINYHTDSFDTNGVLATADVTVERDEQGRISKYVFGSLESIGDMWFEEGYTYDEAGLVTERTHDCIFYSETVQFAYDEKGHLAQKNAEASAEGEEWQVITNYTLLEFDDHGNWTKRLVQTDNEWEDSTEERQITYRH